MCLLWENPAIQLSRAEAPHSPGPPTAKVKIKVKVTSTSTLEPFEATAAPRCLQDGKVPRNAHGNVEVPPFSAVMPAGTVRKGEAWLLLERCKQGGGAQRVPAAGRTMSAASLPGSTCPSCHLTSPSADRRVSLASPLLRCI